MIFASLNRTFFRTLVHFVLIKKYFRPYHRQSGLRTEHQRPLPDKFYTNSDADIFPDRVLHPEKYQNNQQQVNKRQDLGVPEQRKTTSFRETAIIALKLSQSIMNLYETVSPYLYAK